MVMELERKLEVNTFEEIGLTDPTKPRKSNAEVVAIVKTFDFFTSVYPTSIMDTCKQNIENYITNKPPKCIFLPEKQLARAIIRALAKYEDLESLLLRFGIVDS